MSLEPKHLELLERLYTDRSAHSGGALLDHLLGTWTYLREWGNPEYVCSAGLFHSIYATQSYRTQSAALDDRPMIREVIGREAEELAFLFCVAQRRSFFEQLGNPKPELHDRVHDAILAVTPRAIRDLIEVEVANYVEFMPRTDFTLDELEDFQARVDAGRYALSAAAYEAACSAIHAKRATPMGSRQRE
jgi:hypothetical protein